MCGYRMDTSMPFKAPGNFIPAGPKCFKLNPHFLNNSSDPIEKLPNNFFNFILDKLNSEFGPYNITFTYGDNCPKIKSITTKVETDTDLAGVFFPVGSAPSEFDWDPNSINIYFFQKELNIASGATGNYVHVRRDQLAESSHEMGHYFGLNHTHSDLDQNPALTKWECKDRTGPNSNCENTADKLCGTEADPRGFLANYEFNCSQLSSADFLPDKCGNNTTKWKVPFKNYMSYYTSCYGEFVKEQTDLMFYNIENNPNIAAAISNDCGGSNDPACADIVINIPTIWANGEKKLCPGQKIIITADGSLILDNFKLTIKGKNPDCPLMGGFWDGIYISSGGAPVVHQGGPTGPLGGFISVTKNSIIEYSNNGIQAPNSHSGISILNSIMRENGMAIYAKGPGGSSYSSVVNVSFSQISNAAGRSKPVLILLNGSDVSIESSSLTNFGGASITGVKSYNARVSIKNGTIIDDFDFGIDKELNGGFGIGLSIQKSKIINCITAIRNTSSGVSAKFNFLDGFVKNFGKAYGTWFANNFRKHVTLDNPSLSHTFQENNFYKSQLGFSNDQSLTDARCNQWENIIDAVFGNASMIKSEWGSISSPSGNKWLANKPSMEVNRSNQITNWQKFGDPNTYFNYAGQFVPDQNSQGAISCNYALFPTSFGPGGGSGQEPMPYNDQENRNLWTQYNNQYQTSLTSMQNATGLQIEEYKSQNENAAVGMGQCVLNAWENFNIEINSETYNYWMARTDPIVTEQTNMIQLFNAQSYPALINYLNSLSISNEENLDRNNMITASTWLAAQVNDGVNIYNLNNENLNYLTTLASSTFGSYTSLLRSFLNINYNIRIDPPQDLMSTIRSIIKAEDQTKKEYIIYPNPTSDHLMIESKDRKERTVNVSIMTLEGKLIKDFLVKGSTVIFIKEYLNSGIYFIKITDVLTNFSE
ncbi:MAG: T9SS type A sorting domain-containing protein, partial [Saprospiraceae bacterium]